MLKDGLEPEVVSAVMQAYLVCLALVVLPLALSTRQRLVSLEQALAERSASGAASAIP